MIGHHREIQGVFPMVDDVVLCDSLRGGRGVRLQREDLQCFQAVEAHSLACDVRVCRRGFQANSLQYLNYNTIETTQRHIVEVFRNAFRMFWSLTLCIRLRLEAGVRL